MTATTTAPAPNTTLIADLGGTNARFALFGADKVGPIVRLAVADHASLPAAIASFLAKAAPAHPPTRAVLAIAGPVDDGRAVFTNADWIADAQQLGRTFGFSSVRLVNDFAAQAWALPHLGGGDLFALGGEASVPGAPMVVLGPGTGLGVAALVPTPAGGIVISTEGGHVTLPGTSPREDAIIAVLRAKLGHVSAESVLSGPGLVHLHDAIATLDGACHTARTGPEITAAGLAGSCPVCRSTLDAFCAMLGMVAGNLALSFGARGGVFVAGGIAPRLVDYLKQSAFRAQFEAKGRFRAYLQPIPVHVVLHGDPAFVGLAAIARAG
ncbi:glucokinase [Blastochloris viridis]|uniref:Glucokinase n=1 Tax=Blastochloris viridis TaxID=1079 RepID=A0A0H5BAZ9_BLAVI|nr:glucokinase [Blastochloris viridis]ALK10631.1 Glucokinase [Blastochloris viridis]BAR99412.1 glucokinase [Blastochloris viridis]CUU43294.1 Glucokinase [Blastochloris viridis]